MCVHTLQHVVCVPLCVCGSAPVCRVIYWKALQWYQNSFALNACSECLLLPVCFMDHDHTLFVSRFYISKDYFLWLLIFIRAESVSKKARRERWGIVGLVVTMIYQSWRELVLFMSEIVSSALWQEWINNSPIEQGFPATKGGDVITIYVPHCVFDIYFSWKCQTFLWHISRQIIIYQH